MTPDTPGYGDSVQHVNLIAAKIGRLIDIQAKAEDQVVHRLALDYRAGRVDIETVYGIYQQLRPTATPRFPFIWTKHMPDNAHAKNIRHTVLNKTRFRPDPDGIWRGAYPLDGQRYPRTSTPVVYVLFDADNAPCYVGSTSDFRGRSRAHHKDGKPFVRWMAYPCADREAAYGLEVRLLGEYKPYLNRKIGR